MTKNLFLYHSQHTPPAFTFQKRASPGIEPGPPAPKAGILPLNYKAFLLLCLHRCCAADHTNFLFIFAPLLLFDFF